MTASTSRNQRRRVIWPTLRRAGLVETRRAGIWMHYRLATFTDPVVKTIIESALHALTHTEVSALDQKRLQIERAAS